MSGNCQKIIFKHWQGSSDCVDNVINQTRIHKEKGADCPGVIIDNKLEKSADIKYISKTIVNGIGVIMQCFFFRYVFNLTMPVTLCLNHYQTQASRSQLW